MRIEIGLLLLTAFIMMNIYTDGRLLKRAMSYKKYYQMAGVAFGALTLYVLFKKNPERVRDLALTSHEYLKYMPVYKNASGILSPILDFTARFNSAESGGGVSFMDGGARPILNMNGRQDYAEARIRKSGGNTLSGVDSDMGLGAPVKATKRSVSETKKKFVAAQQGWKCGHCGKQLPAWFEVDHKIRLEYGGSNHIDNLVALCRDCHGEKTAMENL
jgi:hypothetical protein